MLLKIITLIFHSICWVKALLTSPWATGHSLWVNLYLLGKLKDASWSSVGYIFLFCFISYASERTVVWDWFTQKKLRQRILRYSGAGNETIVCLGFVNILALLKCSRDTDHQFKIEHIRWSIDENDLFINLFIHLFISVESSADTSIFYPWTCRHPWRPAYSWRFSSCVQWLFERPRWSQDRCA